MGLRLASIRELFVNVNNFRSKKDHDYEYLIINIDLLLTSSHHEYLRLKDLALKNLPVSYWPISATQPPTIAKF